MTIAAVVWVAVAVPPPASPQGCRAGVAQAEEDPIDPRIECGPPSSDGSCAAVAGFRSVSARARGRGLRLSFVRRARRPVRVDVFRSSNGRRIAGPRLVARFGRRARPFTWSGRSARGRGAVVDGYYYVRYVLRDGRGGVDIRRITLERRRGRFLARRPFYALASCNLVTIYRLSRPVFGGLGARPLTIAYRLNQDARVAVQVTRGRRTVRRFAARSRRAGATHRLRLRATGLRRGAYTVRLTARAGSVTVRRRLSATRL